ncbi:MAG: hypothetical protein ABIU77_02025 [Ferruginibacter sp.]
MKKQKLLAIGILLASTLFYFSCNKLDLTSGIFDSQKSGPKTPQYNLEVVLQGEVSRVGHIQFRQDPDAAKIITLLTRVHNLLPNHEYQLQRAVDPINVVDGNCTSTTWLTLGKGLIPQSILTDWKGDGEEELWRNVTAIASESAFDIHFQVIDAVSSAIVLTSDCYQYKVR